MFSYCQIASSLSPLALLIVLVFRILGKHMRTRRERTLALIKPDIIVPSLKRSSPFQCSSGVDQRGFWDTLEKNVSPLASLFSMIRQNGFQIADRRWIEHWKIEEAEEFYREHEGRFFFQRLIAFMTRYFVLYE